MFSSQAHACTIFITSLHYGMFKAFVFSKKKKKVSFYQIVSQCKVLIFRSYEMKLLYHYSVKWATSQTHKISPTHLHSKVINMEDKVFVQVFFSSPNNSNQ